VKLPDIVDIAALPDAKFDTLVVVSTNVTLSIDPDVAFIGSPSLIMSVIIGSKSILSSIFSSEFVPLSSEIAPPARSIEKLHGYRLTADVSMVMLLITTKYSLPAA
jgi:hypothetical protein